MKFFNMTTFHGLLWTEKYGRRFPRASVQLLSSGRVSLRAVPTDEDRTANLAVSIPRNREFRLCQRHARS